MNDRSLRDISSELVGFIEDRGWVSDDPGNLMMSLVGEVGELAEVLNKGKSFSELVENDDMKKEIGFEIVDVFNYLLRIADSCDVDIQEMFEEKMPLLAEKYPIGIDRKGVGLRREEYRKSGKNKLYKD